METVDELVEPAPRTLWDQISSWLASTPARMPTMEDRTPGLDRPPQRGAIDEIGTALMVPQTPLDFGMMAVGGPVPRAAKLASVALGAAMGDPEKADPGKINQQQRQTGIDFFTHPGLRGKENQPILDELRELAIRARKEQRPGGPR